MMMSDVQLLTNSLLCTLYTNIPDVLVWELDEALALACLFRYCTHRFALTGRYRGPRPLFNTRCCQSLGTFCFIHYYLSLRSVDYPCNPF